MFSDCRRSKMMSVMDPEDFYIGYLPKMPRSIAKVVRIAVVLIVVVAATLVGVIWIGQKPFARSFFEFGNVRHFEGTIQSGAVPFLLVEKEEKNNGIPAFERFPLVAEGKHGADVEIYDGRRVSLDGTLIYRDDMRMIEVADGSVKTVALAPVEIETPVSLGQFTLHGEIVDSKCYLGVMNPGQSKPHRDCAVACLRGGIPALFIVRDEAGNLSELWLVSKDGKSVNSQILDYVAEPLEITGEVTRLGDQLFFKIDPGKIKRL